MIAVKDRSVTIKGGETFGCIDAADWMAELATVVKPNDASLRNFRRMMRGGGLHHAPTLDEAEPLTTINMIRRVQVRKLQRGLMCTRILNVRELGAVAWVAGDLQLHHEAVLNVALAISHGGRQAGRWH